MNREAINHPLWTQSEGSFADSIGHCCVVARRHCFLEITLMLYGAESEKTLIHSGDGTSTDVPSLGFFSSD